MSDFTHTISYSKLLKHLQGFAPFCNNLKALLEEIKEFTHIASLKEIHSYIINQLNPPSSDKEELKGFFLKLRVGQGGADAQNWTRILFEMYQNFFVANEITYQVEHQATTNYGTSAALILIKNPHLYNAFKYEEGIHRVERIPPFNSSKNIQTSETYVQVIPYIPAPPIEVSSKDLKIETVRSGGPGGQHANKNYTGVRIKHLPTGFSVTITSSRSLQQNRLKAITVLKNQLYGQYHKEQKRQLFNNKKYENQKLIRTYDIPQDTIRSYLYNLKLRNVQKILKGNINILLLYNLIYDYCKRGKSD